MCDVSALSISKKKPRTEKVRNEKLSHIFELKQAKQHSKNIKKNRIKKEKQHGENTKKTQKKNKQTGKSDKNRQIKGQKQQGNVLKKKKSKKFHNT